MMLAAALGTLEASCFCGAVRLAVDMAKPPISVSVCHCATCRRLTGAPSLANLVLPAEALTITPNEGDALTCQQTSKHVKRTRCATCFSPVYATLGKGRVVVPLSLFSPPLPETWRPQHHLYYDRRVIDVADNLPKYRTHFGSALWDGEPPEAGEGGGESD